MLPALRSIKLQDNRYKHYFSRCFSAIWRHFQDVINGGILVVLRKVYCLFLVVFAVPAVVIIRLLRPLVTVRFGSICAKRIGHFAASPEIYLCERDQGTNNKPRVIDIFYYIKPVSNYQLKRMWDRMLCVWQFSRFTNLVDRINRFLPKAEPHIAPISFNDRDIQDFFRRTPPHLSFTDNEEIRGEGVLRKFGINDSNPFVCFHARNSVYLNTVYSSYDWRYHNYRDSSISNYILAAEELTHRGYFVIRMGVAVKEPLDTTNLKIIDYAVKHRTDFMDIYLSAKCKFFISSNSGISMVSTVFRRPVVFVNFVPIEWAFAWSPIHLFIPKKLWSAKEKRFLSFGEILDLGIAREPLDKVGIKIVGQKYKEQGIDVIENTPQEIAAVVREMDQRLNGTWEETEEDKKMQSRFWALFKNDYSGKKNTVRIGAEFLRQNRNLLDEGRIK